MNRHVSPFNPFLLQLCCDSFNISNRHSSFFPLFGVQNNDFYRSITTRKSNGSNDNIRNKTFFGNNEETL